ncbi:hypothetical protein Pmar_PMAR025374 [Perkinsus marinus ATCC 50983]|uniref:Uncharacterized protein n=1 Tax=Perkinsus marinus (strain ATCC 50983 / TXsc) TaxID=423536 RepID=C5KS49_PERM5|nr:hypothetical protein Pmar_PMAR025374 [Perkinsus marinus ATCC 50983]EER12740.1 hypothetical protein Pmar_PMAR025374 [Perkinsus marinus ATCC 50983]|eukprot:XP_002780945.1 hypothetical protein Pmar_PMAR025374 [Perkinsus marinus ATCC 50983]
MIISSGIVLSYPGIDKSPNNNNNKKENSSLLEEGHDKRFIFLAPLIAGALLANKFSASKSSEQQGYNSRRDYSLELKNIGRWTKDMMQSYNRDSGRRKYNDDVLQRADKNQLQGVGWNEFIGAQETKRRVTEEFPAFLYKLSKL